jgi:hypothetical protein
MFELAAMDEIPAPVSIEVDQDLDGLAIVEEHSIFPAPQTKYAIDYVILTMCGCRAGVMLRLTSA